MSRAPIDRTTEEYKRRRAALDRDREAYSRAYPMLENPPPQRIIEEMQALGVDINGQDISEDDVTPKAGGWSADMAQARVGDILALDEAVKQNSDPQQNKKSYGDVGTIMARLTNGSLLPEEAKKLLAKIGAESNDISLKVYLASVGAILDYQSNSDLRAAAFEIVQEKFAFLKDEKGKQGLEEALLATQQLCEDQHIAIIPEELARKIEAAVADIDVEVEDKSQQKEESKDDEEKKKEEEGEKEKEEEKKKEEEKREKEGGVNKANIAKKTIKYGSALGIAVGFPPFGIAIGIGMLVVAKNWGEDKKDKVAEAEAKKEGFMEGKKMVQVAKDRIEEVKVKRREEEAKKKLEEEEKKLKEENKDGAPDPKDPDPKPDPEPDPESDPKDPDPEPDPKPEPEPEPELDPTNAPAPDSGLPEGVDPTDPEPSLPENNGLGVGEEGAPTPSAEEVAQSAADNEGLKPNETAKAIGAVGADATKDLHASQGQLADAAKQAADNAGAEVAVGSNNTPPQEKKLEGESPKDGADTPVTLTPKEVLAENNNEGQESGGHNPSAQDLAKEVVEEANEEAEKEGEQNPQGAAKDGESPQVEAKKSEKALAL